MTPRIVAGSIISNGPTDLRAHTLTYLLTYLLTQNNQCFDDWPAIYFPEFSANDLSSVPLPLVGLK